MKIQLEQLELDLAITGIPPSHFGVTSELIGDRPQIIIASPSHEFANRKIKISNLKQYSFLLHEPGSGTRTLKFFSENHFTPCTGVEFGSNETIKQAGMGVAIISAHTVAAEFESNRLVSLNVKGMPINKKWFVVRHKNKQLLPSSLALWEFIIHSGKQFLPNGKLN